VKIDQLSIAAVVLAWIPGCQSAPTESWAETSTVPAVVKVAACQIRVSDDMQLNLQAIQRALETSAALGADIACFPETSLLGWVNPNAHDSADAIPGPTTQRLGEMAQATGLMICVGLAERDGDRLHDSAILIDRDGSLLLKHRKANILTELMDPPYTPGTGGANSVVQTRFGRIGLLICADTFQDDVVQQVADQQPDLVLVPYGWAAPEKDWPQHGKSLQSWVAHTSRRTQAPVVGVDCVGSIAHGPWRGFQYGGQSVASDASGKILGVLADRAPEVRIFELRL
jgi:predicted amidohydrolase